MFFGMGYGHKVTDIERSRQIADKQIEGINLKISKAVTEDERLSLVKQKDELEHMVITLQENMIDKISILGASFIDNLIEKKK